MSDKKNTLFPLVLAALCFCILFPACKSGMDDMLDDYNSHYTPTKDPRIPPKPGDPDFDEKKMLFANYYVNNEGSVNLCGPNDCASYYWRIFNSTSDLEQNINDLATKINYYTNSGNKKQEFRFYIPNSSSILEVGTYKIKLVVTDSEGTVYTDIANLIIYERK